MYTTKRVEKYLNMAKEASKNSDFVQHRLGSVIVYKGMPLALGWNTTKTSPVQKEYNRAREGFDVEASCIHTNSTHAEMLAMNKIANLDIDFSKVSIFVFRSHRDGTHGLARPCAACRQRMLDLGIKDCYFTTNSKNGFGYERIEE